MASVLTCIYCNEDINGYKTSNESFFNDREEDQICEKCDIKLNMQNCGICNINIQKNDRYDNLICEMCSKLEKVDEHNNVIDFHNVDWYGGLQSSTKINNTIVINKLTDGLFFINGIKCRALEHRFGGVVYIRV